MRQPDEDDYGFSSKTESEMYEKMVKGFVAQNDDKKFSKSKKPTTNLSATKVHSDIHCNYFNLYFNTYFFYETVYYHLIINCSNLSVFFNF